MVIELNYDLRVKSCSFDSFRPTLHLHLPLGRFGLAYHYQPYLSLLLFSAESKTFVADLLVSDLEVHKT